MRIVSGVVWRIQSLNANPNTFCWVLFIQQELLEQKLNGVYNLILLLKSFNFLHE